METVKSYRNLPDPAVGGKWLNRQEPGVVRSIPVPVPADEVPRLG